MNDSAPLSADVLAFVIPTFNADPRPATEAREAERASHYPSVNELGRDSMRGGEKSDEYHWLFNRVYDAAKAEMERVGWWTAEYYVDVYWTRIVTTRRGFDAMNTLKCELDAMEDAGVYVNDRLVVPHPSAPQYDPTPGAIDRIRIVVERRWYPIIPAPMDVTKKKPRPKRVHSAPSSLLPHPVAKERELPKTATLPATGKTTGHIRTLDQLKSGDVLSLDEFEANREEILSGGRPRRPEAQPPRARLAQ